MVLLLALTASAACGDDVLTQLKQHLALPVGERPSMQELSFTDASLTREQAETAKQLLLDDRRQQHTETYRTIIEDKRVKLGDLEMPFEFYTYGNEKPDSGWPLYISLHGGGGTAPRVNDRQWENQKRLYKPKVGIYCAPRAPTNTWNLWHQSHIDAIFGQLIEAMVYIQDVDWNRIYVMGYSAGGDGVYQLGPRLADRWAAAAMMAGHPNDAAIENLRNLPFALQVGGRDAAYKRNTIARKWGERFEQLAASDPGGYEHFVKIYDDKGHWMDREDRVALPWMAKYQRNAVPSRVVWEQDDVTRREFYWLSDPKPEAQHSVVVNFDGQTIEVESANFPNLVIHVDDRMLDLERPVVVKHRRKVLLEQAVARTIKNIAETLQPTGDPNLCFSGRIDVDLSQAVEKSGE
ncbi:MAG: hypothetical protein Aurels2KO_13470 [Aureliella sp.]